MKVGLRSPPGGKNVLEIREAGKAELVKNRDETMMQSYGRVGHSGSSWNPTYFFYRLDEGRHIVNGGG